MAGGEHLAGRLLVCAAPGQLPPYHGGGAQVTSRMLGPLDPADYVLVTFGPDWQRTGVMPRLGAPACTNHLIVTAAWETQEYTQAR